MPVISHHYKYIFFAAPLTGSTSVSHTLINNGLGSWVPAYDVRVEGKTVVDKKHGTLNQLRKYQLVEEEHLDSYYKFTGVRNPFDRTYSEYFKMRHLALSDDPPGWFDQKGTHAIIASENDFPTYVEIRYTKKVPVSIANYYTDRMDQFLRMEHLADDFELAKRNIGLPADLELLDINTLRGERNREYRDYYDDQSRELVERAFREYIEYFEYDF